MARTRAPTSAEVSYPRCGLARLSMRSAAPSAVGPARSLTRIPIASAVFAPAVFASAFASSSILSPLSATLCDHLLVSFVRLVRVASLSVSHVTSASPARRPPRTTVTVCPCSRRCLPPRRERLLTRHTTLDGRDVTSNVRCLYHSSLVRQERFAAMRSSAIDSSTSRNHGSWRNSYVVS